MIDEILTRIKELRGQNLKPTEETYYLFMSDGVAVIDTEEDTNTLRVTVTLQDEETTFVYEDKSLSIQELMKLGKL